MTIATAIFFSAVAILLWTWIVFPVLMVGIARFAPRRPSSPALVLPHVTVIVAPRDVLTVVRSRIEDLFAGDYPAEQLDVVLCIDAAIAGARKQELHGLASPRLKVIAGDLSGGKAATVNAGVCDARTHGASAGESMDSWGSRSQPCGSSCAVC